MRSCFLKNPAWLEGYALLLSSLFLLWLESLVGSCNSNIGFKSKNQYSRQGGSRIKRTTRSINKFLTSLPIDK
jgi:hypothetical protein